MEQAERERLDVDVVVVGAGPAGLAAAIHLVRSARERGLEPPSVAVLEKASEIGGHSISGAVMDPRGLDALIPDWRERGAPVEGPVEEESMLFLGKRRAFRLPFVPGPMRHHGGVIVSLQRLVAWLGAEAEKLEIDLFAGFAAAALLVEDGRVVGVRTGDRGLDKRGRPKGNYEPGYDIRAKVTLLAEGVRGTLAERLIRERHLRDGRNPMIYAGGAKEVWKLPAGRIRGGRVWHTLGWPLARDTFGGGFIYEMGDDHLSIGMVVGLDSPDPRLNVHEKLQELKRHPFVAEMLRGGEMVAYAAKAIPEGGYWSLPKLATDGALLLGDSAGLVNAMRLKGIHLAIESGIAAAEVVLDALAADDVSASRLMAYDRRIRDGEVGRELHRVRNFRQPYQRGLLHGLAHTALQLVTGGRGLRERYPAVEDHRLTRPVAEFPREDEVPAPDGSLTFDKMADVYRSGTRHEENQPPHLVVVAPDLCVEECGKTYGHPCEKFCPAGVYEIVRGGEGPRLHLNFSNCVHCKICDIADPYGVIYWTPPEGGDGPRYRLT